MSEDVRPYGAGDERDDNAGARLKELRALTEKLGQSQRGLARELELDERTMRYYFSGQHPTPLAVVYAVRYLALRSQLRSGVLTPEDVAEANARGGHAAIDDLLLSRLEEIDQVADREAGHKSADKR